MKNVQLYTNETLKSLSLKIVLTVELYSLTQLQITNSYASKFLQNPQLEVAGEWDYTWDFYEV